VTTKSLSDKRHFLVSIIFSQGGIIILQGLLCLEKEKINGTTVKNKSHKKSVCKNDFLDTIQGVPM
jgi:hypothetical protein